MKDYMFYKAPYIVITLLVFFLLMPLFSLPNSNYSVSGKIYGCGGEKIVFSRIYGKEIINIDSVTLTNSCSFQFFFPDSLYVGVYKISINYKSLDIIFNKENIVIESVPEHTGAYKIIQSEENKLYWSFLSQTLLINDSIKQISLLGDKLYEEDPKANSDKLKKLYYQITELGLKKQKLSDSLILINPKLFAAKIIKASLMPIFKAYMKKKDAADYPNEIEFLREHFFDNIDFTDSSFLHTKIIYDKIGEYLWYVNNPPSVDSYKKAIDFILVRAADNNNIYDYVINSLLRSFYHSDWEDVYSYVVEKYISQNTCSNDEKSKDLLEKSNTIKALKKGNKAPEIVSKDVNGKETILDSIRSPYTLIIFWASWCEFCEKSLPELKSIYALYNPKGLEIFAYSLDSIKQNWVDATNRLNISWINTSDLKGYEGTPIKSYNIWSTPTFFLLDKDKKIIAKPANINILKEVLKGL